MKMKNERKFDKKKLTQLKKAYSKAIAEGKTIFIFESGEYLVSYARYLILEMKLNESK